MKNRRWIGAAAAALVWLGLTALMWFGPRQDISGAERRKLQQMPEITAENVGSGLFMTKFESFTQDQFPLRDGFRRLRAVFDRSVLGRKDSHGIYLVGNQAAKVEYPLNARSLRTAQEKFGNLYEMYLKDRCGKIVFSVVPDKGYYLAEQAGVPAMDYGQIFEAVKALDWAEYADITDCLSAGDYYRTDAHWRQEVLGAAAEKLCGALGVSAGQGYRVTELDRDFYGVYYGQSALPMEPEKICILENDVLDGCRVTNLENNRVGGVYDMEKLDSRDLYDVFLSGPVSVLSIENPAGQKGKELVVFRDSFGSSMVPLLVTDYEKITVVDIRYVPTNYVGNFVEFHGQDVLFLYSTTILNTAGILR